MCGRMSLTTAAPDLEQRFGVEVQPINARDETFAEKAESREVLVGQGESSQPAVQTSTSR